jgi:hypothetical protein
VGGGIEPIDDVMDEVTEAKMDKMIEEEADEARGTGG